MNPRSPARAAEVAPAPAQVPLGPAGPVARTAPKGRGAASWAQLAQGLLQRARGPVAAMLLGAAALPFAGAPVEAQAAPVDPIEVSAPARVAPAVTRSAVSPLVTGPLTADGVYAAYVESQLATLRAQLRQFQYEAPRDPVVQRDLLQLEQVVARFDTLMTEDARLPAGLLADLGHVLDALRDARPGQLMPSLDAALRNLPSTLVEVPGLPAVGRAPGSGAVPRLDGPGDGALRDLLASSPTDFPDKARDVLARYRAVMSGADAAVSRLPDFAFVSPNPLLYDSGDGRLVVPPGARLVKHGGQFSIEAPGMLWQQGGLTVVSQQGAILLGSDLDGLTAQRVTAQGEDWSAQLTGATIGVSRTKGFGVIRADEATLDLAQGQAHLTGAQLVVGASGDATLIARHLSATDGGLSLDIEGLRADQTRTGTSATADRLRFANAGTLIEGEQMDVRFGPGGARVEAQDLTVVTGRTTMDAHAAVLTATPTAGGGHLLTVTGERFGVANGDNALAATNGDLTLALDARGQLRSAQLSGDALALQTADGRLDLGQGAVDVALDARGGLSRVSGRTDSADFVGQDMDLSAQRGRVDATFTPDGHLAALTSDAAQVRYQGASGALSVTGGALTAQLEQGRLQSLTAGADAAHWVGTDGARVDAEGGRLGLAFAPDGVLQQASLQAGSLAATDASGRALSLSGTRMSADFDPAGNLTHAAAETGRLGFTGADGTFVGTGRSQLDVRAADGLIRQVTLSAQDIRYQGRLGELTAARGSLDAELGPDGLLQRVRFDTRDLSAKGDFGRVDVKGAGWLSAQWAGESLSGVAAHADQLDFKNGADALSVTGGDLSVSVA
ncbi:MAG: hypothetical protein KC933_37770, partial [Myxococcales bacterium]|nr:hypothetical protein [Myxococcales bacterium]